MQNIKFFIFTCVYNGKKYINRLLDSMLKQDSNNFIHYIYDDGSTDDIGDIINEYKEKASKLDKPFKVIYERNSKNIGNLASTQHCLDKVLEFKDCNYFGWINADDWLKDRGIKTLTKCILKKQKRYDVFFYQQNLYTFVNNRLNIIKRKKTKRNLMRSGNLLPYFVQNAICADSFLAKSEILKDNSIKLIDGVNKYNFYNDLQFILICSFLGYKSIYLKKYLYCTLIREDSISYNQSFDAWNDKSLELMQKSISKYSYNFNLKEYSSNINIYGNIIHNPSINRKKVFELIKSYRLYKTLNKDINCKILYKIRILIFLLFPKLFYKLIKK